MRKEFWKFLEELDGKWRETKHFPICRKLQKQYYEDVEEEEKEEEGKKEKEEEEEELEWKKDKIK